MIAQFLAYAQSRLADREKGATAVEYGLMVALIAAVIIVTVIALGLLVDGAFENVVDAITGTGTVTPGDPAS